MSCSQFKELTREKIDDFSLLMVSPVKEPFVCSRSEGHMDLFHVSRMKKRRIPKKQGVSVQLRSYRTTQSGSWDFCFVFLRSVALNR